MEHYGSCSVEKRENNILERIFNELEEIDKNYIQFMISLERATSKIINPNYKSELINPVSDKTNSELINNLTKHIDISQAVLKQLQLIVKNIQL